MTRNYDNWERLVAAVIKRQQIWEQCHQPSRSPSICSEASTYSSGFSSKGSGFTLENIQESAPILIPKLVSLEGVWRSGELDKGMKRSGKRRGRLNWESRLKIAIGAARGIAHIHRQCGGKLAHGNVKSSNIFLDSKHYGRVPDFSLAGLMESPANETSEFKLNCSSQENDVYSFGVVLLQLLLGRSLIKRHSFGDDIHLVKWDDLVFGRGMELEGKIKAEMVEMLQVAMKCLGLLPQDIPKMFDVVFMQENIVNCGNTRNCNWEDSEGKGNSRINSEPKGKGSHFLNQG